MNIVEQIERITTACYQQKDNDACRYIEQLIPELMAYIAKCQEQGENGKAGNIVEVLKYIMGAMEAKDYVLAADYIKYELVPIL